MLITPLLPYPNFRRSVACYSDAMLEDTLRFIVANRGIFSMRSTNLHWEQQDLMKFWRGRGQAFIRLGLMCAEEAKQRGVNDLEGETPRLTRLKKGKYWLKPMWVGWDRMHADHRGTLLQHGETARVLYRVAKRHSGAKDFLYRNGWCELESRRGYYITDVNNFLDTEGFPVLGVNECPNHYAQFNWAEEPNGESDVWPPSNGDWNARTN